MKMSWSVAVALAVFAGRCLGIEKPDAAPGEDGVKPAPVRIEVAGSDTMLQIGLYWADEYKRVKPHVGVRVSGEGSSTGFKSLIDETADIACSSRPIKDSERERIVEKRGVAPVEHIVGYDVVAVFVHPDNPATSITFEQLKKIYASDAGSVAWREVTPEFKKEIQPVGRNNSSATYGFFKKTVLGRGVEMGKGIAATPGSKAVVEFVAASPGAIGYAGFSYKTDKVKMLSIENADGMALSPDKEEYALRRPLYIYTVKAKPEVLDYLDWIKSAAGQGIVADQGFMPIR